MKKMKRVLLAGASVMSLCFLLMPIIAFAAEEETYTPSMYATIWALVPPIVAIVLALIIYRNNGRGTVLFKLQL